jgi:8-hydroxy-5-deazaflavin:NADPH oxidoreductase
MSEAATAIIGVGNIGRAVARHLVAGGEPVLVASRNASEAEALAEELGPPATAPSVGDAIAAAPAVVLALWFGQTQEVLTRQSSLLEGRVDIDPSNPLGFDADGQITRTLPADQSQASIVAGLLLASAHYVKAFGTVKSSTSTKRVLPWQGQRGPPERSDRPARKHVQHHAEGKGRSELRGGPASSRHRRRR